MSLRLSLPALVLLLGLGAAPAYAASDLRTTVNLPTSHPVDTTARYQVNIRNIGNRTASAVSVTISLPRTNTSPTVYVMGDVMGFDSRCTRSGATLTCSLGSMARNAQTNLWVDLALPYSAAPIAISATAQTTSSENSLTNNTNSKNAVLTYVATPILAPENVVNEHCTGTNLTSFYECELFPSSISGHNSTFLAGGTLTTEEPTVVGTWSQPAPDRLVFTYTEFGVPVANFSGYGVGLGCFEGLTTFPGSPYVAPYSVCLQ